MGGVIGALSTKFALTAGTLLFAARVDMHPVMATLDPSLKTTQISQSILSKHVGASHWIALDRSEIRVRKLDLGEKGSSDLVIGRDVLKSTPLVLNFKTHHLRVMESSEFHRAISKMVPLDVTTSSDGCLSIAGTQEDGQPVHAALVGRPQAGETGPVLGMHVGAIELTVMRPDKPSCSANELQLGWSGFEERFVILDLGHNRIWMVLL